MPGRLPGALVLLVALLCPAARPARAQEFVYPTLGRDDVRAQLGLEIQPPSTEPIRDRIRVRLSGRLVIRINVQGPDGLEVEPHVHMSGTAAWKQAVTSSWRLAGDKTHWQETLDCEPLDRGQNTLAVFIRFRKSQTADTWQQLSWKPTPLEVTSEIAAEPSLKELRDVTPPEEPPPERPWYRFLAWPVVVTGALLAAGSLLLGAWEIRRRRAGHSAPLPPEEWALGEIAHIETLALPEMGQAPRYHQLLSDVVRCYLEKRFWLHAPQRTTAEFLDEMRRSPLLPPAQQMLLREFLERCDLAKFARADFSTHECRAAAVMARAFVEQASTVLTAPRKMGSG